MGVEAPRFLVGQWRGEGRVRGDAVTARVVAKIRDDDDALVIDHTTVREGAADHRERIVIRTHRGRTSAFIRAEGGVEQRFQSVPASSGWLFTRTDPKLGFLAWEIAQDGPDAFTELFTMGEGAAAETVVTLRHARA